MQNLLNDFSGNYFLIFFLLPLAAAAIPTFDTVTNEDLPFAEVMKSHAFWGLWAVYFVLAAIVIVGLVAYHKFGNEYSDFMGVLFGFPMLLQSKLFSYRDANGNEVSVGFTVILKMANSQLVKGMKQSIIRQTATMQKKWLELDPARLGNNAKNYLTSHPKVSNPDTTARWIDDLISDLNINQKNRDANLRAIFSEVKKIGELRGVSYVISESN